MTDVDYLIFDREKNRRQLVHYDRLKMARQIQHGNRVDNTDDQAHANTQTSDAARTTQRSLPSRMSHPLVMMSEITKRLKHATLPAAPPHRSDPITTPKPTPRLSDFDASDTRKQAAARARRAAKPLKGRTATPPPITTPEPPRIRGTEQRPLRSTTRAPKRFGYDDPPPAPKPARYAKGPAAFTRLHTFLSVVALICAMPAPNKAEDSIARAPGRDVIVLPEYGIALTHCGSVIMEQQRLMFSLVLHLNLSTSRISYLGDCKSGILTKEEFDDFAYYSALDNSLLAPAWLQASVRTPDGRYLDEQNEKVAARFLRGNDTYRRARLKSLKPSNVTDNATEDSEPHTRFRRFVVGPIALGVASVAAAIAGTALGLATYSVVEIKELKSKLGDLSKHVQTLDDRVTDTHNSVIRVAESQRDFYHYTQKAFADLATHIDEIVCGARSALHSFASLIQRNYMINKLYTDLSAVIASIFSGRVSPLAVPVRTLRALIASNKHLFADTIYWNDPILAYTFASVIPVWPLAVDRVAFVLVFPNLKQPTLTPLYCTTSVGLIHNDTVMRYRVPPKLINNIYRSSSVVQATQQPLDNITVNLEEPLLEQCRTIDNTMVACPATVGTRPWACATNASSCSLEIRSQLIAEYQPTTHGYAIRSPDPCYILDINGTRTPVPLHNGFVFVPFAHSGVLRCGTEIALPLERRGVEVTYTYNAALTANFNATQFQPTVLSDWAGITDLDGHIREMKNRDFSKLPPIDFGDSLSYVTIGTIGLAAAAFLVAVLAYRRGTPTTSSPAANAIAASQSVRSTRRRRNALRALLDSGDVTVLPIEEEDDSKGRSSTMRTRLIRRIPFWIRLRNHMPRWHNRRMKSVASQATKPIEMAIQTVIYEDETVDDDKKLVTTSLQEEPPAYVQMTARVTQHPQSIYPPLPQTEVVVELGKDEQVNSVIHAVPKVVRPESTLKIRPNKLHKDKTKGHTEQSSSKRGKKLDEFVGLDF